MSRLDRANAPVLLATLRCSSFSNPRFCVGVASLMAAGAVFLSGPEVRGAAPPTTAPASASTNDPLVDEVRLRDGTSVVGHVLANEPGVFVRIETEDGQVFTIAWSQVARVSVGVPKSATRPAASVPSQPATPRPEASAPAPAPAPIPTSPAPGASPTESPAAPSGVPDLSANQGGLGATTGGTFKESESARQQWAQEGGWLLGQDAIAQIVLLRMSSIDLSGWGFGGGVHGTVYNLTPPGPEGGSWVGFRAGAGVDAAYVKVSVGDKSLSASSIVVPVNLGAQVGLGGAESGGWSGVMLGVDYRPSYQYTRVEGYDGEGGMSWPGFQVTADFVSFDQAADNLASKAQWRVSAFVLPETDSLPFLAILGFGAVWY